MAGCLRRDPKTLSTRELDNFDYVLDRLDERDRERPLIDREIPGLASLVPVRIADNTTWPVRRSPRARRAPRRLSSIAVWPTSCPSAASPA